MSFADLLDRKQAFLDNKNFHFSKSSQKFKLFYCFFLRKLGRKMRFGDLLDRKQAFLDCKNFNFLKSRNWTLFKGVNA